MNKDSQSATRARPIVVFWASERRRQRRLFRLKAQHIKSYLAEVQK